MKPFLFRLESLRMLREQKELTAQKVYARALVACEAATAKLERAAAELAAGWESLRQALMDGSPGARLAHLRQWCSVLEVRHNERKAAAALARQAADAAFQQMSIATRDREAMDKFCEKSRSQHALAVRRQEQKEIDELAVQLFRRRSGLLAPRNQAN